MAETKVALVTGGAKRVGRAIVDRLLLAGFDVAYTYLSSVPQEQSHTLAIKADLTDPQTAVAEIYRQFTGRYGRLDVLINSASLYKPARLRDTELQFMQKLDAIHVHSPVLLCKAFESMLRSSSGHVINMVDLLAEKPWPEYLAYCASKAGLLNLTLGLAKELAPEVTVNGIAPGVVEWPADYPESERQKYLKRVPLARAGTPNDVAELVYFLATSGSYITGQIIHLDGGRSIT